MFPTPQGGRRRQRPQQQFSDVEDSFSDEGVVEAVLTRSGGARGQVWAPHWSVAVHATDIRSSADGTFPDVDDHAETRRGALWPNLAILALVVAIACAVGVVLGGGGGGGEDGGECPRPTPRPPSQDTIFLPQSPFLPIVNNASYSEVLPTDVMLVRPDSSGPIIAPITAYTWRESKHPKYVAGGHEMPMYKLEMLDRGLDEYWNFLVDELLLARVDVIMLHGRGCYHMEPTFDDSRDYHGSGSMCPRWLEKFRDAVERAGATNVIRVGMFDPMDHYGRDAEFWLKKGAGMNLERGSEAANSSTIATIASVVSGVVTSNNNGINNGTDSANVTTITNVASITNISNVTYVTSITNATNVTNVANVANITNVTSITDITDIANVTNVASTQSTCNTTPFDMGDPKMWTLIWDHNVKIFFDIFPREMWYLKGGKPVISTWKLNLSVFCNLDGNVSRMLQWLKAKFLAEYGVEPTFITQKDWIEGDPTITPDLVEGVHGWISPSSDHMSSITEWGGKQWGVVGPGYRKVKKDMGPKNPYTGPGCGEICRENTRQSGWTAIDGLETNRNSELILLEGWTNIEENNGYYRSIDKGWAYPTQYINIVRHYADPMPETLRFQAEGADNFCDTTKANLGGSYSDRALDVGTLDDGSGWYVGWIEDGEWLEYQDVELGCGTYRFTARVAAKRSGGVLRLDLPGLQASNVPNTGGYQKFELIHLGEVRLYDGSYNLRIVFESAGISGVNLDWFFVKRTKAGIC